MFFEICAHRVDKFHHILWDRRMPFHLNSSNWVIKTQHRRMQRLAIEFTQHGDEFIRCALWWTRTTAVNRVTHQRMGNMRHVHADLVSTPGFQTQTQARMNTEMFHDAVVGYRRFTHWVYGHMRTLGGGTADRLFHRAARGHMTNRHRVILTGNFAPWQRFHQASQSWDALRHHHQTRGVVIQTVHDTGTRYVGNRRIIMKESVKYRTVRIARARMNNKVARLVDDQNIVIFVDDIQRDILRLEADFLFDFSIDGDSFPTKHFLFWFVPDLAVYQHALVKDPFFYA